MVDVLAEQLADAETTWSLGTFGAIAEFVRDADEPVTLRGEAGAVSAVTARGGVRIGAHRDLRLVASESLTSESWNQRVAICLPRAASAMGQRTVITEVGPDRDALRPEDRAAALFDLGLGALQVDCCVRSGDPAFIAALRADVGKPLFGTEGSAMHAILAAHPHRVFISRVGRIEVFQPIPPPDGRSPEGPHTHVLPKLLRGGRTHAATEPIPAGFVPCAHFYPPNPLRDSFGRSRPFQPVRHAAFQKLLARYGTPQLIDIKRRVIDAVLAGRAPSFIPMVGDRFARTAVRIALRQLRATEANTPALPAWLAAHDAAKRREAPAPD
jgi:hypothetical protein